MTGWLAAARRAVGAAAFVLAGSASEGAFAQRAELLFAPSARPFDGPVYAFEQDDAVASTAASTAALTVGAIGWERRDAALATLFVRLHFDLERGAPRRALALWDAPILVSVEDALGAYRPFIGRFAEALRARAGAPVVLADARDAAGAASGHKAAKGRVILRAGPAIDMRRWLGQAACAAFPGDWRWPDLVEALKREAPPRWSEAVRLDAATIFVPDRAPPWLMRACVMEEIAQALGPAGDLFWLRDSIFNDDNVRLAPTALDFLMIRLSFAPELAAGMSRAEAERAIRAALARERREGRPPPEPPRLHPDAEDWRARLRLARSIRHPTFSEVYYRKARTASEALAPDDPRRLWTRFEAARDMARSTPKRAARELDAVSAAYAALDGPGGLYQATVDLERAQVRLALGRFAEAGALARGVAGAFARADREDLRVQAAMVEAAAGAEARRVLDAGALTPALTAWRDYAFGVRQRSFEWIDPAARAPLPEQGYGPIALAMLFSFAPILLVAAVLRRIF